MDETTVIKVTLDAYKDLIKESFRFECLKHLIENSKNIAEIGRALEAFGINTRIGELY